ncbi:MAG: hypothetical protein Q9170_004746 [Blastenia crenularia]
MTTLSLQKQERKEAIKPFLFLSLPLELRRPIYTELLIPSTLSSGSVIESRKIWHDRHGLQKHIPVYPQILLANKQVNAEATAILYEENILKIDISSAVTEPIGPRTGPHTSPQYLFRSDPPPRYFDEPGKIYPQCLRRIAKVEIKMSLSAIRARAASGYRFSHIGNLLVEVLRVLAEDNPIQQLKEPRRLLLEIHKRYYQEALFDLFPKRGREKHESDKNLAARTEMTGQIPPLLDAVAKVRKVEIVLVVTYTIGKKTKVRTRNIDLKNIRDL